MKILVTGGAGFIGSNLVEFLLKREEVTLVRVFDNLVTGSLENIQEFRDNEKFEFIEGDIRDKEACLNACSGIDAVSHQAALGSVPRSINDPVSSHDVNVNGFINILEACRKLGVKRIVYASSSAVYGDLNESPKVEERVGKVLSPYAATKMTNELYAEAYSRNYDMSLVGLRYFNVFGPKQDPEGPYAAVIPLFMKAALKNESPIIFGDGTITRDFTPVGNVVQINWLALTNGRTFTHEVINVACNQSTSLKALWSMISKLANSSVEPRYGANRKGDIMHSLADVSKAVKGFSYAPTRDLNGTLAKTLEYYSF